MSLLFLLIHYDPKLWNSLLTDVTVVNSLSTLSEMLKYAYLKCLVHFLNHTWNSILYSNRTVNHFNQFRKNGFEVLHK